MYGGALEVRCLRGSASRGRYYHSNRQTRCLHIRNRKDVGIKELVRVIDYPCNVESATNPAHSEELQVDYQYEPFCYVNRYSAYSRSVELVDIPSGLRYDIRVGYRSTSGCPQDELQVSSSVLSENNAVGRVEVSVIYGGIGYAGSHYSGKRDEL